MSYEIDTTKTYSGLVAPHGWHIIMIREDGFLWERLDGEPITVIESIQEKDGKRWLHVSVAKPEKKNGIRKMPTYEDLQEMRRLFVGEDRECYMVFPTKERYININPVLHLFCCLDQPEGILPHFEESINGKMFL